MILILLLKLIIGYISLIPIAILRFSFPLYPAHSVRYSRVECNSSKKRFEVKSYEIDTLFDLYLKRELEIMEV